MDIEHDPEERRVGDLLADSKPVPDARFRGALGRQLLAADPGYGPRPPHLRVVVAAYLALGALLIALGCVLAVGVL